MVGDVLKCHKTGLCKDKIRLRFWPDTKTPENVRCGPVCPRFHERPADPGDEEPGDAGVGRPTRLDDRPAGPGGWVGCGKARSPRETAWGRPPAGDRRGAGLALGPLGSV